MTECEFWMRSGTKDFQNRLQPTDLLMQVRSMRCQLTMLLIGLAGVPAQNGNANRAKDEPNHVP